MKRIILLLVLLIGIAGFSQEKIEVTKDGLINTTQVIELNSLTAKEIYTRINKYIQKNYVSPKDVSKGNIDNEFVSFNGLNKNCITEKVLISNFYSDIEYYITIDIKEGKIKYSIAKLVQIKRVYDSSYEIDLLSIVAGYYKSNGTIKPQFVKVKMDIEKVVNDTLTNLIASVKETKTDW